MKNFYQVVFALLFTCNYFMASAQCTATTNAYPYEPSCNGYCDGYIILMTSGGSMPYTVLHPVTGSPMTYTSAITIPNLCEGSYTLAIQDNMGCPYSVSVILTEPPALTATLSNTSDPTSPGACDGTGTVAASGGTGAYSYYWFNCSDSSSIGVMSSNATNLCAGDYAVQITDANACVVTTNCVTWSDPCNMVSTYSATSTSCYGSCDATATVITSGGTPPYSFTDPATGSTITYSSVATLNNLCAGSWTLLISDASGCTEILVITISQPSQVTPILTNTGDPSSTTSCDGTGTVNVTGGLSPYAYNWIDCNTGNPLGVTTATTSSLCNGIYQVEITDNNGCTAVTSCEIWNSSGCSVVSTVYNPTPSCSNSCSGSITLTSTNGTPPYTYTHPNSGSQITYTSTTIITGLCDGTWTINISDANGCVNTQAFTITQTSAPVATLTNTGNPSSTSSCDGSGTVNVTGGTTPYAFDWLDCSTNITIGNTQSSSSVLCEGSYYVIVTDVNGCMDTTSCETWFASPCNMASTVSNVNNVSCNGGCDGNATFFTTGGQMPYTFPHPISGATITYTSFGYVNGLCAGTWTLNITDVNGCTDFLVITITEPPALNAFVAVGNNPSSSGSCDGTMVATVSGGTGSVTYNWIECDSMTPIGVTTSTASGLCAGSYGVIVTDVNGCVDTSACDSLSVPTDIFENENSPTVTVFPNPTNEKITIILSNYQNISSVQITDISGRIIYTQSEINSNKISLSLDGMNMWQGVYLVNISSEGVSYISRFIYNSGLR